MIEQLAKQAETDCKREFSHIQAIVEKNQKRMLEAFRQNHVSDYHFQSTTGYGYDDSGRDVLEAVYADVFGAEDALVRRSEEHTSELQSRFDLVCRRLLE